MQYLLLKPYQDTIHCFVFLIYGDGPKWSPDMSGTWKRFAKHGQQRSRPRRKIGAFCAIFLLKISKCSIVPPKCQRNELRDFKLVLDNETRRESGSVHS